MKKVNKNQVVALIFAMISLLWTIQFACLFYSYHFVTGILYLFMYPDWFLIVNMTIGIIGFYISVLLFRNKLKMKSFLIIVIVLFLVGSCVYSSLFFNSDNNSEILKGKKAGEEFCGCLQAATDSTKREECATATEEKYGEKLKYGNFGYGFQTAFENCQHLYFVEEE